MMNALGTYLLSGRLQAAIVVTSLAVLSLWAPLFAYLSGVPLGLATLRKGYRYGMEVLLAAGVMLAVIMLFVGIDIRVAATFGVGIWLPVYLCCRVLRRTESQGWMVLIAGVLAMLYVVAVHILIDDVPAWWLQQLQQIAAQLDNTLVTGDREQFQHILEKLSPMINAVIACSIVINLVCTTLIARWWQAMLFNPGGFRAEFYALLLPLMVVFLPLIGIILITVGGAETGSMGTDILILIAVLYGFQGLSGVHRIVANRKLSSAFLVLNYVLLVIIPQMFLFLALLGLADSWAKYRGLIHPKGDGR